MSEQTLQPLAAASEQAASPVNSADRPIQFGHYLTAAHAAVYLDCPSVNAFRMWARRHGVHPLRRGRTPLYVRRDLDKAIGASSRPVR